MGDSGQMGQYRIPGDFIQDKPNPVGFTGGVVVGECSGTGNSQGGGGGGEARRRGQLCPHTGEWKRT